MQNDKEGILFSDEIQKEIKNSFCYVDEDPDIGTRLFFDNAGGAFRLKKAVEKFKEIDMIPDCPERNHKMAIKLTDIQTQAFADIRLILNAHGGSILPTLTASQGMADMVRAVAENVPGTNMVTTVLEHPSAFDPVEYYAKRLNKEFRVAKSNLETGGIDVEEIIKLIDKDTCLLSVIYASNISGAILDIETIIKRAREIKPDLYIIVDAVQHAPHGVIDLMKTPVDGINFAPYKYFGCRGFGISWLSERASILPHHKLLAKSENEWELGSPAPAHFAVLTEIVNYVCWIGRQFTQTKERRELFVAGMNHIKLHERALLSRMLNGTSNIAGLRNINNVEVFLDYHDLTSRDLIIAVGFKNMECDQAVREYAKRKVIVYERVNTSPYSKRMLQSFNMKGAVRVSPLHCNSKEDIDLFLKITAEIAAL